MALIAGAVSVASPATIFTARELSVGDVSTGTAAVPMDTSFRALLAEWVSNVRSLRDNRSLALALHLCAAVGADGGDTATARAYYAQALVTARGLGAELNAKPHWAAVIASIARTGTEVRPRALRVAMAALCPSAGSGPAVPLEEAITAALEELDAAEGQTLPVAPAS